MNITGSAKISVLDFAVEYDISNVAPTITVTNHSTGSNLAGCTWWLVIKTPSQTTIHAGTQTAPDFSGVWTSYQIPPNTWPTPFNNQIEFSGNPYSTTLYVNDGTNTYSLEYDTSICRPVGNTEKCDTCHKLIKNTNFGWATLQVTPRCGEAQIYAEDRTNYSYQGIFGTVVSKNFILEYPLDETGSRPANFVANTFNNALIPLAYGGPGFTVFLTSVLRYVFPNGTSVVIKYKNIKEFAVYCNINLYPLLCDYKRLIDDVRNGKCGSDNIAAQNKLNIVTALMMEAVVIAQQPGCNDNLGELVEKIKKEGGFTCNCYTGFNTSIPAGSSKCCPIVVPVWSQGTGGPPPPCPNSYFPVVVFAPDGTTPIGYATDVATMIAIINGNALWRAYGTAFDAGNCQVGFYPATGVTIIPTVIVKTTTGYGGGIIVNIKDHTSGTTPPGCPDTFYPATVYDPTNTTIIGTANNSTELLNIINTNLAWRAYGIAILVKNCQVTFYPNTGVLTIPDIHIGGGGGDTGGTGGTPIADPIYVHTTSTYPTGCPASSTYFPCTVYDPTDTTALGIANNITELLTILNSTPAWLAYGTWSDAGGCKVNVTPATGVTTIPPVHIATGTGCVGDVQLYTLDVTDFCSNASLFAVTFPANFYVDFGAGIVALGSCANYAALIAALNATPTKPPSVTFAATGMTTTLQVIVDNSDCTAFSGTIHIYGSNAQGQVLVTGGNAHTDGSFATTTGEAADIYMPTDSFVGRICGLDPTKHQWDTLKDGNRIYVTEPQTGKVYVIDVTNPITPTLAGTVSLSSPVGGNFGGAPSIGGKPCFFNLYLPTDYMGPSKVLYIVESNTGTLWALDTTTLVEQFAFQDNKLIAKCPRVLVNNKLFFTQDGYIEQAGSLASGVAKGECVVFNTLTTDATGLSTIVVIQNLTEWVWSAAYDGANTIWFVGKDSSVVKYDLITNTVTNRYIHAYALSYTKFQNTVFYNGRLYISGYGEGTRWIPVSGLPFPTVTVFQSVTLPSAGAPSVLHWNFKPVAANCFGLLTLDLNGAAIGSGIVMFDLDGNLLGMITRRDVMFYNVVCCYAVPTMAGNTLCPIL